MWPFKIEEAKPFVLRALVGERDVCSIQAADVPTEQRPVAELLNRNDHLRFIDSQGASRTFDMSTAFDEGDRFFHMSVRVGPSFAVQADGIVTKDKGGDPKAAMKSGAKGIRIQPFLLPESTGRPADLVGRGLFFRGLHFSGSVTPGNVSLLCLCDRCQQSFRLQSFHAGFSNRAYFYCSNGPHTLVLSAHEEDAPPVLGKADHAALHRIENRLPACATCGGVFRYLHPLRCPHCQHPFIDFARYPEEREREYYGNYLYGASLRRYDSNAPRSKA